MLIKDREMNLRKLAEKAGFDVLETGTSALLVSDPASDAIVRFAALVQAAERKRFRQVLSDQLAGTVMSKYVSKAECEAARAALRNAMLDAWGHNV